MRSAQRKSSRHSAPVGESRIDSLIQQRRKEAGIVNNSSIPNKGNSDYYGNPFNGLPREKLANNAVGPDEADANFLAAKHFIGSGPARLPAGVKVRGGSDIDGTVDPANLPNIGGLNGQLPGGRISGNIDVSNLPTNIPAKNVPHLQALEGLLNIGGKNSQANIIGLPAGRINGNLPWSQVGTRGSRVPNFAKQNDLDALERRVRKLEQRRPK